jgi:hypothetical protein
MTHALRTGMWMVVVVTFLTGCGGKPASANITDTDWGDVRRSDANCSGKPIVDAEYYDLNGDGEPEAFLTMRCKAPTDTRGIQLEIVDGSVEPALAHPYKLVDQTKTAVVDRLCFAGRAAIYRVIIGGKPKVKQVRWAAGAAEPVPPIDGPAGGCPRPIP